MATQTEHDESVKKLSDLIKGIRMAMLTTAEDDGSLRSRPMATQDAEFDGSLWFFTRAEAPKVDEVRRDDHVNLSYAEPKSQQYVSVSGRAELVRDPSKIHELWNPLLKAWFPKGLDDPELALLRIDVDKAEYWDSHSSAMVHLIGFVKASVTGKPYEPGQHEKIDLA